MLVLSFKLKWRYILKNIIFVINKEKVYAYVVSICTIVALFFMSSILNSNDLNYTKETSTNITQNVDTTNELLLNITTENK